MKSIAFNKLKNRLSITLYKYKDYIDYNSIKDDKLRYSIKAHLNGKLHMKRIYLDNMPNPVRNKVYNLKEISQYKYKWGIKHQEEFIKESDWYKRIIKPLITYNKSGNKIDNLNNIFLSSSFEFRLGQLRFTKFSEKNCIEYILAFLFFYYKELTLNGIFELAKKYYPVKYKNTYKEENVLLILKKLKENDLIFYEYSVFKPKEKLFDYFVDFVRSNR